MKNWNVKSNLSRKAATIASAIMTLSTVTVLAMAPMSQAQAGDPKNQSVPPKVIDPNTKSSSVFDRRQNYEKSDKKSAKGDPDNRHERVPTVSEKCTPKPNSPGQYNCVTSYRAEGGGRTALKAEQNAKLAEFCNSDSSLENERKGAKGSMYGNTWYYRDYTFDCKRVIRTLIAPIPKGK